MIGTHTVEPRTPDGGLSLTQTLAGGTASALFAVLAGVGLGLAARGGPGRLPLAVSVLVRALLIGVVGLFLADLDAGLAIILTYYAVAFALAVPFLGASRRVLFGSALVWMALAPVLSHLVRPDLPERGVESPTWEQLGADPGGMLSELLLTGYYPAVPWLSYVLLGMALGRCDLRAPRVLAGIGAGGLALLALGSLSRLITATSQGVRSMLVEDPDWGGWTDDPDAVLELTAGGTFGTTPTGGDIRWLLVGSAHSGTPFDLARTAGAALLVIALCCLVAAALSRGTGAGPRWLGVLAGAGAAPLTCYSLHVLLRSPDWWPRETPDAAGRHLAVVLLLGALLALLRLRGPLEAVVALASRGAGRLTARVASPRGDATRSRGTRP